MRILFLVEYLKEGGIERILQQMMAQLPKRQMPCAVYAYETPTLTGLGKEIEAQGGKVFTYQKAAGFDLKLVRNLAKVVREENISVIHTHDFGPTEYAVALKILFPSLQLVHTQHTLHHFINNARYRLFLQCASPFYSAIACVSKYVEDELSRRCRFLRRKLITIPNGVDTDKFRPANTAEAGSSKFKLINISRISPEKNLITLLKASAELAKRGFEFEVHHIGSGSVDEESKIKEAVKSLGLESYVFLHGFQSDVRPFLENCDLFISSSLTEGHPVSVIEAMAIGLPCLLSDISPHREFQGSGVRFFTNEPSVLAAKLASILTSPAPFLKRSVENRDTVLKKFSMRQMINRYSEVYGHA